MVRKVVAPASASTRTVVPRACKPKNCSISSPYKSGAAWPPALARPTNTNDTNFPLDFSGVSRKVATQGRRVRYPAQPGRGEP